MFLVNALAEKRKFERAITIANNAVEYHENSLPLKLVKVELLLSTGQAVLARQSYKELQNDDVKKEFKQGVLGRIYLIEKNYKQAAPLLLDFYHTYPSANNIINVAVAFSGDKQPNKSVVYLNEYLETNEKDIRVRALLANFYITEDRNKALAEYEKIIKQNPKNFIVSNNLAWLYFEKGELEKALEHSKQAFEIAPKVPNVNDTYGQVLLHLGKKQEALVKAMDAYNLSGGKDVAIALNYTEVLIGNKRLAEAKQVLENVSPVSEEQASKKALLAEKI